MLAFVLDSRQRCRWPSALWHGGPYQSSDSRRMAAGDAVGQCARLLCAFAGQSNGAARRADSPKPAAVSDDRPVRRFYDLFDVQLRNGQPGRTAGFSVRRWLCGIDGGAVSGRALFGVPCGENAAPGLTSLADKVLSSRRGMVPHDRPSALRSIDPSSNRPQPTPQHRLKTARRGIKTSV